ncbi:putative membrane protein YckC, RDD family [Abditibacterium utsteinense]|uniref:Putative membrane protein YckC, RDD family n=1 Tax=Abditibacterium utsteinense TaxID=1960156 RepID=A0A2S8SUX7_9BACT|nr:RDD family protein [Abditibacterium utsteinense]PQV64579.1 putative membrane protein YckC, RDD family [Abditibacterium utsteinense]
MRSYWDEDLAILSAENVSFSIETAGLGSRFAALALDTFYQTLIYILLLLAAAGIENYVLPFESMPKWLSSSVMALYLLITFALFFGYYFVFEWLWDGQTPGKRFFGMRVMMSNGLPLTVTASLARNAVRIVDFLPMAYGFGALVSVSNALNQRMGDLVAGTIVVRENKDAKQRKPLSINEAVEAFLSAATTVPGQKVTSKAWHEDETLQSESATVVDSEALALSRQLSREDYELARDYLSRRDSLPLLARERLGRALAVRLAAKLGQNTPTDFDAFIGNVLAILSRVYA